MLHSLSTELYIVIAVLLAASWLFSSLLTARRYQARLQLGAGELERLRTALEYEQKNAADKIRLLTEAKDELSSRFQTLSTQALQDNNQQFLQLAKQVLGNTQADAKADLEKRQQAIQHLLEPLSQSLLKMEAQAKEQGEKQVGAYGELREKIHQLTGLQSTVQQETQRLVEAIRKPQVRGRWGEITLKRVLEMAGMTENCDFIEQDNMRSLDEEQRSLRPDVRLNLPDTGVILIDAKVPFDAFLSMLNARDDGERQEHCKRHINQIRTHIKQLSAKSYWQHVGDGQSVEFVILFIPSESAFSAAVEADPALLEHAWQQKIIITTPTTLMATVMAVAYSWKQQKVAQNAADTARLGRELHGCLLTFIEHLSKTGNSLKGAVDHYNSAVGSLERRLLPKARQFENLQVTVDKPLDTPAVIETYPRLVEAS